MILKWKKGADDGKIIYGYLIEWKADSTGEHLQVDFVQHENDKQAYGKNKTITPGELYTITISAINSVGNASAIAIHRARKL